MIKFSCIQCLSISSTFGVIIICIPNIFVILSLFASTYKVFALFIFASFLYRSLYATFLLLLLVSLLFLFDTSLCLFFLMCKSLRKKNGDNNTERAIEKRTIQFKTITTLEFLFFNIRNLFCKFWYHQ